MTIDSDITRPRLTTEAIPVRMDEQGVEFHRLARSATNHRWWRPLLVCLVAFLFFAVAFVLLMVLVELGAGIFPSVEIASSNLSGNGNGDELDLSDPVTFALGMTSIILLLPALWLATMLTGAKPVRMLWSVVGKLRWGWFARCGLVGVIVHAVGYSGAFLIAVTQNESLPTTLDMPRTLVLLALTVTLVPLQCAAEEYVFRGYLMQAIGTWLRHPAFAILLPVPLFVLGHEYGPLGMTDVAVFAIAAGYLTWRTGGLEAAIALHVVGNVSGFALAAVGLVDINATEIGIPSLIVSLLMTLAFTVVVLRLAKQHGVQHTSTAAPMTNTMEAVESNETESVGIR